jgi:hypothetical protein
MVDPLKSFVFEWVITNGSLPGFDQRLNDTKPLWQTVTEEMTVYRGQGHDKKGIPSLGPPNVLSTGIRPIISTSKDRASVTEYAGVDCCIFKIILKPGVKYLDVESVFTPEDDYEALADDVRKRASGSWVKLNTPRKVLAAFFMKNMSKEHEIMVLSDGFFSDPVSEGGAPEVFATTYSPKTAGRRRRRKTRRSKYIQ